MQSNEAIYGLVTFFIVNVIINLFLINKYFEEKRKNRILNKSIPSVERNIISFLSSQFTRTKSHNRNVTRTEDKLHKEVIHLRSAYLKIEEKAVSKKIDSPQYWRYIDENLIKLVKIIFPQFISNNNEVAELEKKIALLKDRITKIPNRSGNQKVEQDKARAIASLEQIRAQQRSGGHNRGTVQKKLKKLESIIDIFEDPESRKNYLIQKKKKNYLKNSDDHVNQLSELSQQNADSISRFEKSITTPNEISDELSRFKDENNTLSNQVIQLKSELNSFRGRMTISDPNESFIDQGERKHHPLEMSDITDELIESNEREIDRLRDVIANQRHSIFEMEESLNNLSKLNVDDDSGHNEEIEKLKRCIHESEICITMLETELDELKEDLARFRENASNDLSPEESEVLSEEVNQLKAEIEQSRHQISAFEQLSLYMDRVLSASSIEDVSLLVYETITSLNYTPQLLIKSPERTIELSPHGAIPVREKVTINNMQIEETDPRSNGDLSFRFMKIAGIISPPLETDSSEEDKKLIIKILKATDKVLTLLTHAQKSKQYAKVRDETINSIKHVSYDLDKMIEEHGKKAKNIISRNFQQISDIARARGMTASQVAAIRSIEQETIRQVEAANTLRLKSRKGFLQLIQTIEDAN